MSVTESSYNLRGGSEAGSYLRRVYHSNVGLRGIKKQREKSPNCRERRKIFIRPGASRYPIKVFGDSAVLGFGSAQGYLAHKKPHPLGSYIRPMHRALR